MKRIIHILYMAVMLLAVAACSDEVNTSVSGEINSEQMELNFKAGISEEVEVSTRNVDPDGWGLQTLWLFCFDENGSFIGRSQASLGREPVTSSERTFSAIVSSRTRIVHLLANQVLDGVFVDKDNLGASENMVMTGLESTSSSMVYWGRVDYTGVQDAAAFKAAFEEAVIPMWRNHAAITCNTTNLPAGLTVDGFSICNYYANGTSVPFNSVTNQFDWADKWNTDPYVTTPVNHTKASDPEDIDTEPTTYIYETDNQGEDELYMIFKLTVNGTTGYYKVALVDENKDPLPIYRNYRYTVHFTALPSMAASPDFASAKQAAPLNNTWVSVSAEIPSIGNNKEGILTIIGETTKIYETGGEKMLEYTYTGTKTPVVKWISDDGVAASEVLEHHFDPDTDKGTITFTANQMTGEEVHRGTLQVKAGPLVRFIKIITVKKFSFTPIWCSSGIIGKAKEDVSLTFSIPETYPQELLPLRCLISTSELSGNGAVTLDVVYADDPDFGEDNGLGYKYVYLAETVGQQRIYFQTNYATTQHSGHIKLEAEHFESIEKQYDFNTTGKDWQLELTGQYVSKFSAANWGGEQEDSFIYYQLVPRKKGTEVSFALRYAVDGNLNNLQELPEGINIAIYTSNLEPVDKTHFKREESSHGSGPFWYYTTQPGEDHIAFTTLKANSEEVIRFVSITENGTGEYRSCTMELANYREWIFNQDNLLSISGPCDYGQERDVKICFAVKEFWSDHEDTSIPNIYVNPGDGFKVYIDTENLTIGDNPSIQGAIEKTATGYSYTVAAADKNDQGQVTLNFKTNKIVSGETITLRSDDTTTFTPAELKLSNAPLTGTITCTGVTLPADAFVTLERKDGTRIGRVTLTDGGSKYSIILRGEFNFGWDDELFMTYKAGGKMYQAPTSLNQLYTNKNIVLNEIH